MSSRVAAACACLAAVAWLGHAATLFPPPPASARRAEVLKKFQDGNLAVSALERDYVDDPYHYNRFKEWNMPTLVEQMKEWNQTGHLWAGLSMSQIRPEYRDHSLFAQFGYLLDWTKCHVHIAAPWDLGVSGSKLAGNWTSRKQELLQLDDEWRQKEQTDKRVTEHIYLVVPNDALDDMRAEYQELCQDKLQGTGTTPYKGMKCLGGGSEDEEAVHEQLKAQLLQDVNAAYVGNTSTVGGQVYTEMVAHCPLDALEGLVVSLRGVDWKKHLHGDHLVPPLERITDADFEEMYIQEARGLFDLTVWAANWIWYLKVFLAGAGPVVLGSRDSILRDLYDVALKWKTLVSEHVPRLEKDLPVFLYEPGVLPDIPGWTQRTVTLAHEHEWSDLNASTSLVLLSDNETLTAELKMMAIRQKNDMKHYVGEQYENASTTPRDAYVPVAEVLRVLEGVLGAHNLTGEVYEKWHDACLSPMKRATESKRRGASILKADADFLQSELSRIISSKGSSSDPHERCVDKFGAIFDSRLYERYVPRIHPHFRRANL